jgi:YHS domain-containing protein
MKIKIIAIITILLFLAVPVSFAAEKATHQKDVVDVGNKFCPVSGDPVTPGVTYIYKGKLYHFCCAGCPPVFKKDPEKYIAKMKKQEAEGASKGEHKGMMHTGKM